jgi:ParB-like nuclease domain
VTARTIRIDDVVVGDRVRTDLGDLGDLIESIRTVGLLHPIVITPKHRLISGRRRLEACRALEMSELPATVATNLTDAVDLLVAERDENTCRKEMTVTEKLEMGARIEALVKPEAEQRMRSGTASEPEWIARARDPASFRRQQETASKAAEAVGMGRSAYYMARAVKRYAEDPEQPEAIRQAARDSLTTMDAGGAVRPSHDAFVAKASTLQGADEEQPDVPAVTGGGLPALPVAPGRGALAALRRRLPQRSQHKALGEGLAVLGGLCEGLAGITELDDGLDLARVGQWQRDLEQGLRVLHRLNIRLQQYLQAHSPASPGAPPAGGTTAGEA